MKGQNHSLKRFLKVVGGPFLGVICGAIIAYLIPNPDLSRFGESIDFMEGIAVMGAVMAVVMEKVLVVTGGAVIGLLVGLSKIYKRPRSLYRSVNAHAASNNSFNRSGNSSSFIRKTPCLFR